MPKTPKIVTARDARLEKLRADEAAAARDAKAAKRAALRAADAEVTRNVNLLSDAITLALGEATIAGYRADLDRALTARARVLGAPADVEAAIVDRAAIAAARPAAPAPAPAGAIPTMYGALAVISARGRIECGEVMVRASLAVLVETDKRTGGAPDAAWTRAHTTARDESLRHGVATIVVRLDSGDTRHSVTYVDGKSITHGTEYLPPVGFNSAEQESLREYGPESAVHAYMRRTGVSPTAAWRVLEAHRTAMAAFEAKILAGAVPLGGR